VRCPRRNPSLTRSSNGSTQPVANDWKLIFPRGLPPTRRMQKPPDLAGARQTRGKLSSQAWEEPSRKSFGKLHAKLDEYCKSSDGVTGAGWRAINNY
jgi:hypothetical protein